MIERGRPILREAVPLRRFDRYVVGGIGRCREARFLFQPQTLPPHFLTEAGTSRPESATAMVKAASRQ